MEAKGLRTEGAEKRLKNTNARMKQVMGGKESWLQSWAEAMLNIIGVPALSRADLYMDGGHLEREERGQRTVEITWWLSAGWLEENQGPNNLDMSFKRHGGKQNISKNYVKKTEWRASRTIKSLQTTQVSLQSASCSLNVSLKMKFGSSSWILKYTKNL